MQTFSQMPDNFNIIRIFISVLNDSQRLFQWDIGFQQWIQTICKIFNIKFMFGRKSSKERGLFFPLDFFYENASHLPQHPQGRRSVLSFYFHFFLFAGTIGCQITEFCHNYCTPAAIRRISAFVVIFCSTLARPSSNNGTIPFFTAISSSCVPER